MGRLMSQDLPDSRGLLGYTLCRRGGRGPHSPDHVHGAEGQAHPQVQPSFLPGVTLRSAWLSLWKLALEIPNALLNKANSVLVKQG